MHIFGAKYVYVLYFLATYQQNNPPDSKFRGVNMGPIWGRHDPGGPHVGPMYFVIWPHAIPRHKNRESWAYFLENTDACNDAAPWIYDEKCLLNAFIIVAVSSPIYMQHVLYHTLHTSPSVFCKSWYIRGFEHLIFLIWAKYCSIPSRGHCPSIFSERI